MLLVLFWAKLNQLGRICPVKKQYKCLRNMLETAKFQIYEETPIHTPYEKSV